MLIAELLRDIEGKTTKISAKNPINCNFRSLNNTLALIYSSLIMITAEQVLIFR